MNQTELKSIETAMRETSSKQLYTHGLDGLNSHSKSGYPKKLSPPQEALLIETIVEKTP